jgi:uncharacterized protein with PQ loop repeat
MTRQAIQVLGTVATLYGLGGALPVLLQARQMLIRGTSGDVSARFFGVCFGGFALWLLYGLGIGGVPIVVVRAVGLLCGATTLAVVPRLRGSAAVAATTRLAGEDRARPGQPLPSGPEHERGERRSACSRMRRGRTRRQSARKPSTSIGR